MRRIVSGSLAVAVGAAMLVAAPVGAQEAPAPEVPTEVLVEDPAGDANFVNDGTTNGIHPALPDPGGNHVTGQDASGVADLLKVWMSHDAETVSVHFLTEDPPPIGNGVGYSLFIAPGEGEAGSNSQGCLRFVGIIPGSNQGGGSYQGPPWVKLHDRCNVGGSVFDSQDGEFSIAAAGDEGITTFTFPRAYSPLFADGTVLSGAYAQAHSPLTGADGVGFLAPSTDDTLLGIDYTIAGGGEVKPPPPPAKKKKVSPKKKCLKLKGAARKKCLKKLKSCKAFTPGEAGAEAETVKLTDKATEKKPHEQTVTLEQSVADLTFGLTAASYTHFNIQVDSKAKDVGLYAMVEFPARNDYDLNLLHTDGSYAARSRGFNTVIETNDTQVQGIGLSATGHGGESTASSEKLVGIKTKDCGGWTLEVANYLGQGGDTTVKLWLGKAENDPLKPGEETP